MYDGSVYGSNTRTSDARKSAQEFEDFTREYERQEQAKRDAALKPLTVVSAEAAREKRLHDFDMGCLWSAPIEDLKKIIDSQQWQRLYWELHFRGDSPRVNQSASAAMQAFAEYIARLTQRTGFKLNDDGVTRLLLLSKVEFFHGIETTQATLDVALDALLKQTAFAEGEVDYDETLKQTTPVAPVAPVAQPKADSFENLSLLSEEGARQGRAIAQELYGDELAVHTNAWRDHMRTVYGFNVPDTDIRYLCEWVVANNKSWLDKKTFDTFRLHMCRTGRWQVPQMLSTEEIRATAVEKCDMTSRDVRALVFTGNRESLIDMLKRNNVSLN